MQVVERWILARLRHHTFFSLQELNTAIADLLVALNQRPFKTAGSRQSGSNPWTVPPSDRCPPSRMSMPSGNWSASTSIITWKSTGPLFRALCPGQAAARGAPQCAGRRNLPQGQTWPVTSGPSGGATARWLPTCPRHTSTMPNGHPNGSSLRENGRGHAQVVEAFSPRGRIPSRASARVWALCGWANAMAMAASKPPATAPSASVRVRTRVLNRSQHALDQQPLPGPPTAAPVMTHGNIRGAQYYHPNQGDPTC